MKILLVSFHFVEYAVELANALSGQNQVHMVLLGTRVQETMNDTFYSRISSSVTFTLLPGSSSLRSLLFSILILAKTLLRFRPRVIHLQESRNLLNLFFFLLRIKPVVTTVHDVTLHPGREASMHNTPQIRLINMARKYLYGTVIVHGKKLKSLYLQSYTKDPNDIFVVPHGCLYSFVPPGNAWRRVAEESHTLLFFGRIHEYKGLKHLIAAEPLVSSVLADFKIIVAGQGQDMEVYKPLMNSNSHFEVYDRFIPNHEVPYFFQRATASVLPYIEASQSGVAAMAYAFGKPVIATHVGSIEEMVRDGETGLLIPPADPQRLSEAIITLLSDTKKRAYMKRQIVNLRERLLNGEHIARLTKRAYAHSLQKRGFFKIPGIYRRKNEQKIQIR